MNYSFYIACRAESQGIGFYTSGQGSGTFEEAKKQAFTSVMLRAKQKGIIVTSLVAEDYRIVQIAETDMGFSIWKL